MIISGLDKDIEFILQEGDYTVEQCFNLIHASNKSPVVLREIARNPRTTTPKHPQSKINIQNFFQPTYLNNIDKGLIQTLDDFRKLMVVLISEKVQLFHPDTYYFYEMPLQPHLITGIELDKIDTMFADNTEQIYNKLIKPIVPSAKLSMEGVEYL